MVHISGNSHFMGKLASSCDMQLIDGISHLFGQVLVGTTEYMAPEVLRRMDCGQVHVR